ncbi:Hypothetical protein EPM1_2418 [Stenotrophomonas maltophilia EPM1]|nr:Hypothetical protein EPM1_2418 [Stenotrophomonas maltophilia EPM1]
MGDREKATRQGGSQRRAAPELRLHQDSLRGCSGCASWPNRNAVTNGVPHL